MSSTIAAGGTIKRDVAEPVRAERFTAEATPAQLAEQLTRLQAAVLEATEATRRNRGNQKIVFEDLACGTGGALVGPLRHGLGRRARWRVVDWTRTTPGGSHGLERAAPGVAGAINDENILTLRSYVAGVASIEVEGCPSYAKSSIFPSPWASRSTCGASHAIPSAASTF